MTGTSGDYPPFSSQTAEGVHSGFDVDLSRALGVALGRRLDLVGFRWPELAERSRAGAFDLVASGVTIRPERTLIGRFTRPYAVAEAVVLVPIADETRYRSLAALDVEGVRVAVNRGGHLERVARASFGRAEVYAVDDNRRLDEEVLAGRARALVTDSIERRKLAPMALVAPLSRDRKALFVPDRGASGGDAGALHQQVDGWLADHNDEIDALRRRWLGDAEALAGEAAEVQAVVALIDQRLGLGPLIAAAKHDAGRPIEDLPRERAVLAAVAERARGAGLEESQVAALFAALIEASKDIQRAAAPAPPQADLAALRRVLTDLDRRLVAELRRAAALGDTARRQLGSEVELLRWPGLGEARRRQLAASLQRVSSP